MTRLLLDASIIIAATSPTPPPSLLAWLATQHDEDLFIAALTLAEIKRNVLEQPSPSERKEREAWFQGHDGPPALFAGRILAFDETAALIWARLMSQSTRDNPRNPLNMVTASIAEANTCLIVSGNEANYPGIEVLNPTW